jgi:hypothetical protein
MTGRSMPRAGTTTRVATAGLAGEPLELALGLASGGKDSSALGSGLSEGSIATGSEAVATASAGIV